MVSRCRIVASRRYGHGCRGSHGATCADTTPAAAEPATTVVYPTSTSATRLTGYAFDACSAPPLATMQAWKTASPYRGVGVYIGGVSRSCAQPNLTAAWVTATSLQGWRIIPIYVGYQAPCTRRPNVKKFTDITAESLGTADAADAVLQAQALGMLPGSAIYGDMEHYSPADAACRTAVLTYVSAWTNELHRLGYLAGMYTNFSSGAKQLSEAYVAPAYARPDALWVARWDGIATLTDWAGIPNAHWSNHQRGKQYRGDHDETHGGVKINIDSNRFDAPVATVGYAYQITSLASLNGRSGPKTSTPIMQSLRAWCDRGCRLPDRWHQDRHHVCLEQADRRQLRQRLLREHAFEHHLQRAAAALHISLPSDHPDTEQAHRPRLQLRRLRHPSRRRPWLGDLSAPWVQGRHDVGLGQAGRRQVRLRLLSGDA